MAKKKKQKQKQEQDETEYLGEWKDKFSKILEGMNKGGKDSLGGKETMPQDTLPGKESIDGKETSPGKKILDGKESSGKEILPGKENGGKEVLPGKDNTGKESLDGKVIIDGKESYNGKEVLPPQSISHEQRIRNRLSVELVDKLLNIIPNKGSWWLLFHMIKNFENQTELISLREMEREYEVTRPTLIKALRELEDNEFIETELTPERYYKVKLLTGGKKTLPSSMYVSKEFNKKELLTTNNGGKETLPRMIGFHEEQKLKEIVAVLFLFDILIEKNGGTNLSPKLAKYIMNHTDKDSCIDFAVVAQRTRKNAKKNKAHYLMATLDSYNKNMISDTEKENAQELFKDVRFLLDGKIEDSSTDELKKRLAKLDSRNSSDTFYYSQRREVISVLQNMREKVQTFVKRIIPRILKLSNKSPSKRA
jgi:DNA-binding HxlR family transcriptional regulator